MSRTIRILYHSQHGRDRKNFNWHPDPPITKKSVVLMSASEAVTTPGVFGVEEQTNFNLGDADVSVTNISPHEGGVEFILHVNWPGPLDVMVDLTVLGPREQFFVP